MDGYPGPIGGLVGVLTFTACWVYAIAAYGVFLGGGLGWIPSFFIAVMAAYLWPLILLGMAGLAVLVWLA